jgi:hypothetical protein
MESFAPMIGHEAGTFRGHEQPVLPDPPLRVRKGRDSLTLIGADPGADVEVAFGPMGRPQPAL